MPDVLQVKIRQTRGKRNARRMRRAGSIPAVLYGHGEETLSLTVIADDLVAALRHGVQLVNLGGEVNEKALIRETQWDTFGIDVLHVDLTRVSEHEKVQVRIAVELRGESPGMKDGGVLDHALHEVEVECPASAIPEKIEANINALGLGQSLVLGDLALPDNVSFVTVADTVVVSCNLPAVELEPEAVETTGAEPEVIGRAAEEEETAEQ